MQNNLDLEIQQLLDIDIMAQNQLNVPLLRYQADNIPTFDGNPKLLNRFVQSCQNFLLAFQDAQNPNNPINTCLMDTILSKLRDRAADLIGSRSELNNWNLIREALQLTFADQRSIDCLIQDLISIKRFKNETPIQFGMRIQDSRSLLFSKLTVVVQNQQERQIKINHYNDFALKTFINGLPYHMQLAVRLRNPNSIEQALAFVTEEENFTYYSNGQNTNLRQSPYQPQPRLNQNYSPKQPQRQYSQKPQTQNFRYPPNQNQNFKFSQNYQNQNFRYPNQTQNFRHPQNYPNQNPFPQNVQSQQPNFPQNFPQQPRPFPQNYQFRQTPQTNVFRPNQKSFSKMTKPVPMDISVQKRNNLHNLTVNNTCTDNTDILENYNENAPQANPLSNLQYQNNESFTNTVNNTDSYIPDFYSSNLNETYYSEEPSCQHFDNNYYDNEEQSYQNDDSDYYEQSYSNEDDNNHYNCNENNQISNNQNFQFTPLNQNNT